MKKIRYLGKGFEVINFPEDDIKLYDPDEGEISYSWISNATEREVERLTESVSQQRGRFIAGCTDIDRLLSDAISQFFFETDEEKRKLFHILILDADILDFKQKEKIFQSIITEFPEKFYFKSNEERQIFIETIDYLIKKRNAFAHGNIAIDFKSKSAELRYYDRSKNKNQSIQLSEYFFFELYTKVVKVCEILSKFSSQDGAISISLLGIKIDKLFKRE
jgi:hypothetical protein